MIAEETIELVRKHADVWNKEGRRIFCTSSFQTQSVPLLHLIGTNFNFIKIIFIDTGFLFPETYGFKNEMAKAFNLNTVTLESHISYINQLDSDGIFMYSKNPDGCCDINKVHPIKDFLREGDVWISGIRRDQTGNRKAKKTIEVQESGVVKFHPMLEWTSKDVYQYINLHDLKKHPLEGKGYISIGCMPCTHKSTGEDSRGGRWKGTNKAECGLHLK
jgi:phosphoadenosine phosphosulfate reductase